MLWVVAAAVTFLTPFISSSTLAALSLNLAASPKGVPVPHTPSVTMQSEKS